MAPGVGRALRRSRRSAGLLRRELAACMLDPRKGHQAPPIPGIHGVDQLRDEIWRIERQNATTLDDAGQEAFWLRALHCLEPLSDPLLYVRLQVLVLPDTLPTLPGLVVYDPPDDPEDDDPPEDQFDG
jgi:hypothetical protein